MIEKLKQAKKSLKQAKKSSAALEQIWYGSSIQVRAYLSGQPLIRKKRSLSLNWEDKIELFRLALETKDPTIISSLWDGYADLRLFLTNPDEDNTITLLLFFLLALRSQHPMLIENLWEQNPFFTSYLRDEEPETFLHFLKAASFSECDDIIDAMWEIAVERLNKIINDSEPLNPLMVKTLQFMEIAATTGNHAKIMQVWEEVSPVYFDEILNLSTKEQVVILKIIINGATKMPLPRGVYYHQFVLDCIQMIRDECIPPRLSKTASALSYKIPFYNRLLELGTGLKNETPASFFEGDIVSDVSATNNEANAPKPQLNNPSTFPN